MLVAVNWSLKKRQPEVEPENIEPWLNYPIDLPKKKVKPKKRKWLEKEPDPIPLPEEADWTKDTHYDPNEYVSPAKTIEQEVDDLQHKPLNSLDRLNKKYGDPNS
jgi:hypothetical protein